MSYTAEEALNRILEMMESDRQNAARMSNPSGMGSAGPRRTSFSAPQGSSESIGGNGFQFNFDASKIGPTLKQVQDSLTGFYEGIKAKFSQVASDLGGIAEPLLKFYEKTSNAFASFAKSTGLATEAAGVYKNLAGSLRGMGMSYEELGTHIASLIETYPGFLSLDSQTQRSIGRLSGQLAKLGVDAKTTTDSLFKLQKVFGMTEKESEQTIKTFYKYSSALGVPIKNLLKDFPNATEKLALFGKNASKVFLDTQVLSSKLGIAFDKLMDSVGRFEGFEDAAETAGNINILFRSNLVDSQELLFGQSPEETVKIWSRTFQKIKDQTGKTFDDMTMFEKKNLAKISKMDLDTLGKISRVSLGQLELSKEMVKQAADGRITLEENVRKTITMSERLEMIKDRILSALMPLMKYFNPILNSVSQLINIVINMLDKLEKQFPGFTNVLAGLVSATAAFKALEGVGIVGDGGIFSKLIDGVSHFIPFGDTLKDLVLPGIGVAFAGLAAKGENAVEDLAKIKPFGEKSVGEMLGLSPKTIKYLQAKIDEVKAFVRKGFESLLETFGIGPEDRESIISGISSIFGEMYDSIVGAFTKIGSYIGTFTETFGLSMKEQEGEKKNPFVKIIVSITHGIRAVTLQLQDELEGGTLGTGQIGTSIANLKTTFGSFKDAILGAFGFAVEADKPGGPSGGILSKIAEMIGGSPTFLSEMMGPISAIAGVIGQIAQSIGSIFTNVPTLSTQKINGDLLKNNIQATISSITGAFGIMNSAELAAKSADIETVSKLAGSLETLSNVSKNINSGTAPNIQSIVTILQNMPKFEPVKNETIESVKQLGNSFNWLAISLEKFNKESKNAFEKINVIEPEKVTLVEALSESINKYASGLERIRNVSSEQDKVNEVLKNMTEVVSTAFGGFKADDIGTAIGKEFYRLMRG